MTSSKFFHFCLVPCLTVMLILSMTVTTYAVPVMVIPRSGDFYRDALPFGYDTVVVDIGRNYTTHQAYRFLMPPGTRYWITFPSSNRLTFNAIYPPWTNIMYRQDYNWDTGYFNNPLLTTLTFDSSMGDYIYSITLTLTGYTGDLYYHANIFSEVESVDAPYKPELYRYPNRDDADVSTIVDRIDSAASSLNAQELSRYRAQMTQESQHHQQDMTQRSQQHAEDLTQRSKQHSEIMNAGADEPTLDINNDWMDDSLSKVNGWLDDLSGFEQQMISNREDNADNLSRAGTFLSDFFSSLPASIIAAMALCLVVIVVVKIVGR